MNTLAGVARNSGWVLCAMLGGCAEPTNEIEEGTPIPDASVLSCGDSLVGAEFADPSGTLQGVTVTVGAGDTTIEGTVLWQVSCPRQEAVDVGAETEFQTEQITVHRDEAMQVGEEIARVARAASDVLSCTRQPGVSEQGAFGPVSFPSLAEECTEHRASMRGGPLFVHVAMSGEAITCSNQRTSFRFVRRVSVGCPESSGGAPSR
ncbi:MAG: hypothetical protein AAGN82_18775 [Myxococcota bacterium]